MDALAKLKDEIKRKRESGSFGASGGKRKWKTRGEIEREQAHGTGEADQAYGLSGPAPKRSKEDTQTSSFPNTDAGGESADVEQGLKLPAKKDVFARLRQRGQPVTLFGESDRVRYERLKAMEATEDGSLTVGQTDDFTKHMAETALDELLPEQHKKRVVEKEMNDYDETWKLGDGKREGWSDEKYCRSFFQLVLRTWENDLNARPEGEKETQDYKFDRARRRQCYQYIEPLLKQLRKRQLEDEDIVMWTTRIVGWCEKREYVRAMDMYTQLSIGNAAWPIGVTMVGIHERTGREKIEAGTSMKAHILSNEVERKFVQQIKRLMSMCQKYFPNTNPSKRVG